MKANEKREDNRIRHEAFRAYYWKNQTNVIMKISLYFLVFTVFAFVFLVPFEHSIRPDLGRFKYGISIIAHITFACFSKWLLETKCMSDSKKAIVSERFSFVVGLAYLIWGIIGMDVTIIERSVPVILMYLIVLAVITAFLYYPLRYFVWLVIISYVFASISFVRYSYIVKLDTTSSICAVIMMLVLGVLSNTRYKYGRDRFEFETKNAKLVEEKEAQNEELEAQNEELIAINQELNDTTEKLSKALDDLEKASESQKMFVNSMNHELRAPLNGIIGTIQIMQMNNELSDDDKNNLNQCMMMAKSLLSIVNDLLDFAKMDAGEFEIFPDAFDLHEVINNIDGMFRNQAESKGLKLNYEIPDDTICGLYGDDFRIQQVIANIVSNAIKYTKEGAVTVNVSFDNNDLKFIISDTGQGMTKESMEYLFVPFKRIAEFQNKKIQGTGLGMSIVMNLIEKMGGTITVNSSLGEGTTFTVTIPSKVTDENNKWNGQIMFGLSRESDAIKLDGKKILYVDDTKINLLILEKLLSETGVQITTTDAPKDGLNLSIENSYDIIMIDHQMPEMSGPELLNEIRAKSDLNKNTPIIAFTGNADGEAEERYKKMGFSGYISKPILKDNLIDIIKKTL